ncbi:PREDICTED: coiled-coil domain-containing protein 108-like [Trachymyrmex septentrionalis]|uniref:coiled-coil domain-containing protein 108-like n=1 Tax=Trachymyrmex septentrionalis TaxID=34720 RepID=UPI00084EFC91|nr:PREDICTED: coiled-coil domain-containing protein 108-like [Trachymyrmex septentrionalis]
MLYEENKKIHVDFGEVETGATTIKCLEIVNESCIEQIYEARRDSSTNPLDHVFELCSYSWSLLPRHAYKCKIYYRPFMPFTVNVDYFTIVNSAGERAEIQVRGTCIGPVVSSSVTRLVMMCINENREVKKRIRFVNDSKVTATFMFDSFRRPFEANLRHGRIEPNSHKFVTITFAPRENGIYTCHFPCLILNHKPIIIELYGYCTALRKTSTQTRFNYPTRLKNGFERYTSDTVVATQNLPTVSSSKNCIDFGQANIEAENAERKIPETLCLTNHSQSNVLIKWDQDVEGIFNITPTSMRIPANQTALFEVAFNPNRTSSFFARDLVGDVFVKPQEDREETLTFPAITTVRLIGHSFPVCSDGWIPQYEIPHVVKMPPCVPSSPTYATFLIRRYGHLPLMYRFVSPASSHFVVKPMMGIIHQDYQIIAVCMLPGNDDKRVYMERWAIRFNGNMKSECFIDFQGYTENANVSFSNQNTVNFASTFPGCQSLQQFYMRNITRHVINYEFINVTPELQIRNENGKIYSNDIITHKWLFCPTTLGDYEFDINCILAVLKDGTPVGPSVCVTLHVTGKCESGVLVSEPDELNFEIQAYKDTKELSFHVFNLSPVNIYYKMTCIHCNWPIGNLECDVKIHPTADTVVAGKDKIITVIITPTTPGFYEFFIQYFVRISSDINTDLIPNQIPRNICTVRCLCVLPTLKVTDLQCYGFYPDMSKDLLWKLMKINMLNILLEDLQPETSETFYINFPAMILHNPKVIVKLLLTNIATMSASWNIKKVQLCSCRPVVNTQGCLKFQRAKYNCLHRKVCSIQPKTGNLKPREEIWITLELHYLLLGQTETKWDLDLGDNRHIFFIMIIECLSDSDNKLQLLNGTHFKFQQVYFGEKDPIYEVCWVHNSTNHSIPFSINPRTMYEINQEYCYKVFSCETPYAIANPQTSVPILLKFQPRKFGIFKGKLRLTLGDREEELTLEGESSLPYRPETSREYIPCEQSFEDQDIPIYFSTDCINVSHIATHSHVVKIIMIHNNLMHDVLAYEWKRREISEIIHVEIYPLKGLIKPKAVKSFHVTIYTKSYPCMIDINIPCEFINASQRRIYQRSVYILEGLSQELKGQFTITEKGISVPELPVKILEKPQPFYKAITIRCSIYSIEDKFLKVSLMKELTSAPPKGICIEENERTMTFKKKDISRSSFIIEGLLWEIINSKLFRDIMQDTLREKSNLFYSQFRMNFCERKKLIQRSYILPPRALINRILEEMLFIIMHEEFSLKTAHLIQHTDIRHIDYLNMVPSTRRKKSIRRETTLLQDKSPSMPKVVSSSRISFAV